MLRGGFILCVSWQRQGGAGSAPFAARVVFEAALEAAQLRVIQRAGGVSDITAVERVESGDRAFKGACIED